ncbi:MAG: glycine zipper 2TM domain-containing protein [Rhodospirillaceae bacterium]|nr:glycine zipper 2TM domain-containing protein [Rhodospirillaceae bacterium]
MRGKKFSAMVMAAVILVGCTNTRGGGGGNGGMKEGVGTILGGVGGAVVGSQFGKGNGQLAMVATGTLLGAFLGNQIGQSLDKADAMYANRAANQAFETAPSGTSTAWRNPDSGNSGTIVPKPAYQAAGGEYCREFTQTVNVGGRAQEAFGTACRQPDGSWRIVQ